MRLISGTRALAAKLPFAAEKTRGIVHRVSRREVGFLAAAAGGGDNPSSDDVMSRFMEALKGATKGAVESVPDAMEGGMKAAKKVALPFGGQRRREVMLDDFEMPDEYPLTADDMVRMDESEDQFFYDQPRFVTHIDDPAIEALKEYYDEVFPKSGNILDICSSWISHYPNRVARDFDKRVAIGLNSEELAANKQMNEFKVIDLNTTPELPYPDNTFDVVTNCVSVDYLNKPLEVFSEVARVLKPGGVYINSFSNRNFPTKIVKIWGSTNNGEHMLIVKNYFKFGSPDFEPAIAMDISPQPGLSDPMFIVEARKKPVDA